MPYGVFSESELEFLRPYTLRRRAEKADRRIWNPPRVREARQEHGIQANDGEVFRLVFESSNSDWQQLVRLGSDVSASVDGKLYRQGVLIPFEENAEHRIVCRTKEGMLWIWNAWQYRGPQGEERLESHETFSGMLVEELPNGYRYRCNEGRDDDDYDDLVFRIERTREIESLRRLGRRKSEKGGESPVG